MVMLSIQVAPCSLENAVTASFGALLNTSKTSNDVHVTLIKDGGHRLSDPGNLQFLMGTLGQLIEQVQ